MVMIATGSDTRLAETSDGSETSSDSAEDSGSNIPVRNWWHMLLYAWDLIELEGLFDPDWEDAPDLGELLTQILVGLVNRQVRRGLRGDYVDRSERLKTVRGRIDFERTLSDLLIYKGQLHCEYQEYSINVPRNQIIATTLQRQARRGIGGRNKDRVAALKGDVDRLVRTMDEIDRIGLELSLFANEIRKLGPNEREYKLMLRVCEMLYRPSMPMEGEGEAVRSFENWLRGQEPKIFELFVANFYKLHLRDWEVKYQEQRHWIPREARQDTGVRLPMMELDIVLRHRETGAMVVIDTKLYESVLYASLGSSRPTVNSDHVFQLYGYLQSLDGDDRRYPGSTGILLYAQTEKDDVDFCTRIDSHPLRVYTLDLSKEWREIEGDLVRLVDGTVGGGMEV